MFTHQYFPRHVTIGAAFDHQVDLDSRRELRDDDRSRWNPKSDVQYVSRAAVEASKLHHGYVGPM
ncbi:MAG: hypothetical protein H0U53_05305 [Actinobacteria bacterium]|nr:hypothetical protein [Actinomycetota bacterium]